MDDLDWLRTRTAIMALDEHLTAADVRQLLLASGASTGVVHPTHLSLMPEGMRSAAAVGYPTGRHHSLIKASEARLAVEFGADEVWLSVDKLIDDQNSLLADIVAVRQAVPPPVTLAVLAGTPEFAAVAYQAGADTVVVHGAPGSDRDIVVVNSLEEAVDALSAGVTRLAAPRADWLAE